MSEITPSLPEGWYDDPFTDHLQRYWTGDSWTKQTRPRAGVPVPESANPAPHTAMAANTVNADGSPVMVRDYLIPSILTLIFCFWPLAVPAVYFAARANSAKGRGDMQVALKYSERARLFIMLAIGAGALVAVYLVFVVLNQGVDGLGLAGEVP